MPQPFRIDEIDSGLSRVTLDLPLGISHVHCYLVRDTEGAWMLVDTGPGGSNGRAQWREVIARLDAPITRIVVTHIIRITRRTPSPTTSTRCGASVTSA